MLVELWHHWLLLRPLLVFLLAGPLVVLALLFRGRGEARRSERKTDRAPVALGAIPGGHQDRAPNPGLDSSPHEWRRGDGLDRRAA